MRLRQLTGQLESFSLRQAHDVFQRTAVRMAVVYDVQIVLNVHRRFSLQVCHPSQNAFTVPLILCDFSDGFDNL